MAILNKEKALYTIQTFLMFLNITKETQKNSAQEIEAHRAAALSLLEKLVAERIDPFDAILEMNVLVESVNLLVKAPYPLHTADSSENLVKEEIVAFEHYLNQELKAHHLSIQEEAPLFNDSLRLWERVGVSLTAKEGAAEFAALIEKLNRLLPEHERYPLPDPTQY